MPVSIPLLPWFEAILFKTPDENRKGWVFNPLSLHLKLGRKVRHHRPDAEWVGKVIARIGKAAGISVEPADERTGRPEKYVTAHDLRRSCGERLRNMGVPPLVLSERIGGRSTSPSGEGANVRQGGSSDVELLQDGFRVLV